RIPDICRRFAPSSPRPAAHPSLIAPFFRKCGKHRRKFDQGTSPLPVAADPYGGRPRWERWRIAMTTETISETETPDPGRWQALRRLRKLHPVWWLNIAVMAAAVVLYAGPVHNLPALDKPHV